MTTTKDLSEFGFRELQLAGELLTQYCSYNSWDGYLGSGITVMMNKSSGYVHRFVS